MPSTQRLLHLLALMLAAQLPACDNPAPGEGVEHTEAAMPEPELVSAEIALAQAELARVDPATMNRAEVIKGLRGAPVCTLSYTKAGRPILAAGFTEQGSALAVIKIHGRLVNLTAPHLTTSAALQRGGTFSTEALELRIEPGANNTPQRFVDAHFSANDELHVGYKGWYSCTSQNAPAQP